jgi:hypothetical protein
LLANENHLKEAVDEVKSHHPQMQMIAVVDVIVAKKQCKN